jgi:GNAT superfamily N-acetyltransferase
MPSVRPAVLSDATALARVTVASWRAAYQGLLPEEVLSGLSEPDLSRRWAAHIDVPRPTGATLIVIEEAERIVGYASVGPSRDQDSILAGATGEIYGFYLHPDAWGRGFGGLLMDAALASLRARGEHYATLNVVEGNERATAFYEHLGWTLDREAAAWHGARQVRYRREL